MSATSKSTPQSSQTASDEAARWTFINNWHVEEQSNDRPPVNGAISNDKAGRPGQRSQTRRMHQLNHKRWSQERHD